MATSKKRKKASRILRRQERELPPEPVAEPPPRTLIPRPDPAFTLVDDVEEIFAAMALASRPSERPGLAPRHVRRATR